MIFDLESNARKPEQVSHVWCICCLDPDTGQQWQFTGSQAPQALGILSQAPKLIGHNVAGYDLPVLERLYGFKYLGEVVDTLILSRLLFNGLSDEPDRHGRHALEAWGKRLGYQKVKKLRLFTVFCCVGEISDEIYVLSTVNSIDQYISSPALGHVKRPPVIRCR